MLNTHLLFPSVCRFSPFLVQIRRLCFHLYTYFYLSLSVVLIIVLETVRSTYTYTCTMCVILRMMALVVVIFLMIIFTRSCSFPLLSVPHQVKRIRTTHGKTSSIGPSAACVPGTCVPHSGLSVTIGLNSNTFWREEELYCSIPFKLKRMRIRVQLGLFSHTTVSFLHSACISSPVCGNLTRFTFLIFQSNNA